MLPGSTDSFSPHALRQGHHAEVLVALGAAARQVTRIEGQVDDDDRPAAPGAVSGARDREVDGRDP